MSEQNKVSILEAASGAIKERADYELAKIIDNIMDPNTRADRVRTLTVRKNKTERTPFPAAICPMGLCR